MSDGRADERGRLLEFVAVMLLALATVGSAWAAFQSSRWNGEEAREARKSGEARLEANRAFTSATQAISYDMAIIGMIVDASVSGRDDLVEVYRTSLVRPAFLPTLDAWVSELEAGRTVPNIFENAEYLAPLKEPVDEAEASAAAASVRSIEAGEDADAYVMTTLFMASALFFAGVTSSFKARGARLILIAAAGFALAIGVSRLVELPIT